MPGDTGYRCRKSLNMLLTSLECTGTLKDSCTITPSSSVSSLLLNKDGRILFSNSSAEHSGWHWTPKIFSVNKIISCWHVSELAILCAFGGSSVTHSLCDSNKSTGPFANNFDATGLSFVAFTFSVCRMNFPEGFGPTEPPRALAISWCPKQIPTKRGQAVGFFAKAATSFSVFLTHSLSSFAEWWLPEITKPWNLSRSCSVGTSPLHTSKQRHSISSSRSRRLLNRAPITSFPPHFSASSQAKTAKRLESFPSEYIMTLPLYLRRNKSCAIGFPICIWWNVWKPDIVLVLRNRVIGSSYCALWINCHATQALRNHPRQIYHAIYLRTWLAIPCEIADSNSR